ncbi:MAG: hypothetical protein K2X81_07825, partial [Candidatus Obscuribacterales bacterium]|nr:hypothetical protein [Candidatus Obscuribacterales bacterium]
ALEIGSYADPDHTWLWSWDNQSRKLTAENKKLKESVLKIGEKYGISTFSQGHYFNIEPFLGPELNGHSVDIFAAIICGELNFPAYYKMPFEHGTALAVIDDADLHFSEIHPVPRMTTVLSQVFIALPIPNHKEAFTEYAKAYHLEIEVINKSELKVKSDDGSELKAEFDQKNRLIEVKAALSANV